eukprot:sb/3465497/
MTWQTAPTTDVPDSSVYDPYHPERSRPSTPNYVIAGTDRPVLPGIAIEQMEEETSKALGRLTLSPVHASCNSHNSLSGPQASQEYFEGEEPMEEWVEGGQTLHCPEVGEMTTLPLSTTHKDSSSEISPFLGNQQETGSEEDENYPDWLVHLLEAKMEPEEGHPLSRDMEWDGTDERGDGDTTSCRETLMKMEEPRIEDSVLVLGKCREEVYESKEMERPHLTTEEWVDWILSRDEEEEVCRRTENISEARMNRFVMEMENITLGEAIEDGREMKKEELKVEITRMKQGTRVPMKDVEMITGEDETPLGINSETEIIVHVGGRATISVSAEILRTLEGFEQSNKQQRQKKRNIAAQREKCRLRNIKYRVRRRWKKEIGLSMMTMLQSTLTDK